MPTELPSSFAKSRLAANERKASVLRQQHTAGAQPHDFVVEGLCWVAGVLFFLVLIILLA